MTTRSAAGADDDSCWARRAMTVLDGGTAPTRWTAGRTSTRRTTARATSDLRITIDDVANDGDAPRTRPTTSAARSRTSAPAPATMSWSAAAGANRLIGGDGDDSLNGGDGADILDGQAGVDTIAYTAAPTRSPSRSTATQRRRRPEHNGVSTVPRRVTWTSGSRTPAADGRRHPQGAAAERGRTSCAASRRRHSGRAARGP